eukprot:gnl/MRDRNA2_/MRDRNA2_179279_c0_seq1.p1 gnl/MRDRNA2_/MRDRNA2_179279_c0~~gnl/MRDRNA2_/MRDRNA2_179279_c0_seq1.p1  ORF type:complete len:294 (-),score=67.49 gnl/MRDRNA2_/MRDRNA2_179279_c0_seq1:65-919(-)
MAPEVFLGNYGPKCDVFSAGVIIWELFVGCVPFPGATPKAAMERLLHGDADWAAIERAAPAPAVALLRMMLAKKETDRATASECLKSPWLRDESGHASHLSVENVRKLAARLQRRDERRVLAVQVAAQIDAAALSCVQQNFDALDTDCDGQVSREEIVKTLTESGVNAASANALFDSLDLDRDGGVGFSEFLAGCVEISKALERRVLWDVFSQYDLNKDGTLTAEELQGALLSVADDDTPLSVVFKRWLHRLGGVGEAMKNLDMNGDARVSFDEFCKCTQIWEG